MNEQLRESLDTALMFQKLMDVFRDVVSKTLEDNPLTNDELSLLMVTAYNGMGRVKIQLANVIGLINERMSWMGDGDGIEKMMQANFFNDGIEDFGYDEPTQDEWHQSDASDEDEYQDEWEIENDEDDDSTQEK